MAYNEHDQGLIRVNGEWVDSKVEEYDEYIEVTSLGSSVVEYVPGLRRIPPPPVCEHLEVVAVYGNEYDEFFMQNPVAHICTVCEARLP